MQNLVIGAGFSGMAAGIKTGAPIYEATDKAGGICTSYWKDGFQFANGGPHYVFENDKTQQAMDFIRSLVELKSYDRNAGVYYNKIFSYPIQTFTNQEIEFTRGYFKQWLWEQLGTQMCNMFFYPFNEKYTAGLMDEIIQFDSYKTPAPGGLGFVSRFHDPVDGLDSLVNKMAEKCDIYYDMKAININVKDKMIALSSGNGFAVWLKDYDKIISTIPLSQMLTLCGVEDFDLPYSSVLVINIGANPGRNLPREHWLYIPFCKCNFYRVGFYTNVDQTKAPPGKVSLCVEIAFRGVEYDDLDIDYITYHVIQELQSWGWIDKVITTDPTWIRHAYTWNRTLEEREKWIQWLKERDIICVGRYATWKFQGLAESIQQGLNVS